MNSQSKKLLFSLLPFLLLLGSFTVINSLSGVEHNPLDQNWSTRQIILGLFMFTSLSFLPNLLNLSSRSDFPFFRVNLSHHSSQDHNSHELQFNNHSICTGCFGTSISILLGNTLLLLYFFSDSNAIDSTMAYFLFFFGGILILFTYSRYFIMLPPLMRIFQHSMLFVGVSLFIIASDARYHSAFFMVFLLPGWLVFLITRIRLSKIEH